MNSLPSSLPAASSAGVCSACPHSRRERRAADGSPAHAPANKDRPSKLVHASGHAYYNTHSPTSAITMA